MKLYGEISKTEAQDDGTIKVWGYASSEAVDSDGEVVTSEAMKAAIPDYMKFGAVREMHDAKKAAGTAIEAEVQDDGRTWFGAHVVDSEAVKKVQAGVYKGFSIGGKVIGRDELHKNTITGLRLVEVSLVDRPANPESIITIMKSEDPDGNAAEMVATNDLKKYMGEQVYDAQLALEALDRIIYLYGKEKSEAEEFPEQVAALVAVMTNIKAFIASEIQEPDGSADSGDIAMAAGTDDLKKADEAEDLRKAFDAIKAESEELRKAHDELRNANNDLAKRVKELEAEPAAPKAFLGNGQAITKAQDAGGEDSGRHIVKNTDGSVNDIASEIRKIHQSGGYVKA